MVFWGNKSYFAWRRSLSIHHFWPFNIPYIPHPFHAYFSFFENIFVVLVNRLESVEEGEVVESGPQENDNRKSDRKEVDDDYWILNSLQTFNNFNVV